ncbi:MAG: hypothetical protein FD123_2389 [Bacteroidetes bacterium]|nr:MAG: hypothetical protein FD123_2389 [Bacteroidota bacterium]
MNTKPLALLLSEREIDCKIDRRNIIESGFADEINTFSNCQDAFEFLLSSAVMDTDCPIVIFVDVKKTDENKHACIDDFQQIPLWVRDRISIVLLVDELRVFLDSRFRSCKSVVASFIKPLIRSNLDQLRRLLPDTMPVYSRVSDL